MNKTEVLRAWGTVLAGRTPVLSIEITKQCPLRCPGCYAFDAAHLGGATPLRGLADRKGEELVSGVLAIVDRLRPLHVSLVGGDPLVRYRELERLLPQLQARGVHTQVVTSAFRPIPATWRAYPHVNVVVSVDGLQPEHDARRQPATYARILKNIAAARVTVHCTITAQLLARPGYLDEFLAFWSGRPEVAKIWFSLFTPQRGATDQEILSAEQRRRVIAELLVLRERYPSLDLPAAVLREMAAPPRSPSACIFARTTETISADLRTRVTPCQFGGDPDCARCGCFASMGLAAVGHYKLVGPLTAGHVFRASEAVGQVWRHLRRAG